MRCNRNMFVSFILKTLLFTLDYGHNTDKLHEVVCKSLQRLKCP